MVVRGEGGGGRGASSERNLWGNRHISALQIQPTPPPQELSSKRDPSPSLSQTQDVCAWYAGWIVDLNVPLKFITGE